MGQLLPSLQQQHWQQAELIEPNHCFHLSSKNTTLFVAMPAMACATY
jgi:hypothetical protein